MKPSSTGSRTANSVDSFHQVTRDVGRPLDVAMREPVDDGFTDRPVASVRQAHPNSLDTCLHANVPVQLATNSRCRAVGPNT